MGILEFLFFCIAFTLVFSVINSALASIPEPTRMIVALLILVLIIFVLHYGGDQPLWRK